MQTPSHPEPIYHPGPCIPPETWDEILDCLAPPQADPGPMQDIVYRPDDDERLRIRTIMACTLVCRSWLPRARIQLYCCVWIATNEAGYILKSTIKNNPSMAALVTRVTFAPTTTWQSLDQPLRDNLVLVSLLDTSPSIKHLVVVNVRMGPPIVPMIYLKTLGSRGAGGVTHLQLQSIILPSPADLISTIHSFKHLTHLSLVGMYFTTAQPADHPLLVSLHEIRPCWAAASLRTLEVGGLGGMSALGLLGDNIERFSLIASIGSPWDPTLTVYRDCVRSYGQLQDLRIVIEPWTDFKPSLVDEGERVWRPIHDYVLDLFHAVQSPALRTLRVSLVPQQQDPETMQDLTGPECGDDELEGEQPWNSPRRYRHTRRGMMDTLFASDIRETLLSIPFAGLATFEIAVRENYGAYSQDWWTTQIARRLPGMKKDVIDVVVDYQTDSTYRKLWEDGTELVSTPTRTTSSELPTLTSI